MFIRCLIFFTCLLFVHINAQNNTNLNENQQSAINIAVVEHEPVTIPANDSTDQSWQTTTERTLIRVTRWNPKTETSAINKRQRRQLVEIIQTAGVVISVAKAIHNTESGEEIMGMAKKVAIAVIVIVSLCIVCCLITTVVVCVKCCCGGRKRKRNQDSTTAQIPQPIFVQTGPSGGFQAQYHQQQAPQSWNPIVIQSPERCPMLPPQPSAPPQPHDHFQVEHPPPPYEKIYTNK